MFGIANFNVTFGLALAQVICKVRRKKLRSFALAVRQQQSTEFKSLCLKDLSCCFGRILLDYLFFYFLSQYVGVTYINVTQNVYHTFRWEEIQRH